MAERKARATWTGDLSEGSGTVSAQSSTLFSDAEVTWASRTEAPGGKTSPEELIAAAHASCFSMAFSNELGSRGHTPSKVEVSATSAFEGGTITMMVLEVVADVPDADDAAFGEALEAAKQSCPVSNALRGNVEIDVKASRA
jgi:osmotically inducible protein OsmC